MFYGLLLHSPTTTMCYGEIRLTQCQTNQKPIIPQRRSANYKPNIWKFDFIETLHTKYDKIDFKRQVMELQNGIIKHTLIGDNQLAKLELVDNITKLGIVYLFEEETRLILDSVVASYRNWNISACQDGLYATALRFRLLRKFGYNVSEGIFGEFIEEHHTFNKENYENINGILELFEASELNYERESVLDKARFFSTRDLKEIRKNRNFRDNNNINEERVDRVLTLSSHKRVSWFEVKWHMKLYKEDKNMNPALLRLAKLNFNMTQAAHQNDLKDIARWWKKLGLIENMNFTRDRLVESFIFSMGLASEPYYNSFRKWMTKVIIFILVIDDVYDLYGSFQELQCFTNAVERWDAKEIEQLPECMQLCFYALYNTSNDMAQEIQTKNGWNGVTPLPFIRKVWGDFCKSLFEEAKWYNEKHIPTFQEYLNNAWISSSGPTLLVHAFFAVENNEDITNNKEMENFFEKVHQYVYNSSLIIRLCNDLATTHAEQDRGDAPSSIICYMKEYKVSEEIARKHIEHMILNAWKQMNGVECSNPSIRKFVDMAKNVARCAHNFYQYGDGFSVQDREMKSQIKSLLVEPSLIG